MKIRLSDDIVIVAEAAEIADDSDCRRLPASSDTRIGTLVTIQ